MLEDQDLENLKSHGLLSGERLLQERDPEFKFRLYREITMRGGGAAGRGSGLAANEPVSQNQFGWKRPVGWAVAVVALAAVVVGLTRLDRFGGEVVEVADTLPTAPADDSPQDSELTLYEIVPAIEDPDFYSHSGFASGYDSITHQLAVFMNEDLISEDFGEITVDEDLLRLKVEELEREFSKNEILDQYLEQVYLGHGFYGASTAAVGYWGRPLSEASVCNLADLAGMIESPVAYDPVRSRSEFESRREQVLGILESQGLFTEDQVERCIEEPVPSP